jgi:asparagine N-glycosylation enzyme membrane subunit Stt3
MNWDLFLVACLAGAANWAFRALPILARTDRISTGGWQGRFLSATGPAAIATLFVASILPALSPDLLRLLPVVTGTLAVLATYYARRSVVLATLAGALVHGITVWLIA